MRNFNCFQDDVTIGLDYVI